MKLENNVNSDTQWDIYEREFIPEQIVTTGSNYMIGNGYYGYRGTFADDGKNEYVGCILSDTYDNADGVWKELVTVPNGLFTLVRAGGKDIRWNDGAGRDYRRSLHFRYGEWRAQATWPEEGITLREERFASADDLHLLASRLTVTAVRPGEVVLTTGIDGDVWSLNGNHFRATAANRVDDVNEFVCVTGEHGYDIVVQEHAELQLENGSPAASVPEETDGTRQLRTFTVALEAGQSAVLTKFVAIYGTNDLRTRQNPHTAVTVPDRPAETGTIDPARSASEARRIAGEPADPHRPTREDLRSAAGAVLKRARRTGWEGLLKAHRTVWDERWKVMDVEIGGDEIAQTVIRYNIYHNIIATPTHTDHLPIGARGLSCQAYQGAAFWDQEIFNLPMFLYTAPEIARNILVYRYRTLDGARRKARDLGYNGAFYAWISGDSGEEICPAYFFRDVVSGRRIRNHFNDWQIHVSPDIAFTVQRYVSVTGDYEFLKDYGAEIVFEIARFLYSRSVYRADRDRYEILRVLGPDEYHENVDNNFFTNFQSRFAVSYAVEVYRWMDKEAPSVLKKLAGKIGLMERETERWSDLARKIFVPEPAGDTRLIEQFSGFFQHEDVTPDELKSRLIEPGEYWGWPNGIAFETQVSKQADVLQLFMLHPEAYDLDVVKANWEYYEPRTQHGSSLSPGVYATVAARVGLLDDAYRYFMKSCTIDLYNDNKPVSGGTFIGGIHTAACGVSWQIVTLGFAGMYQIEGGFGFIPHLPKHWKRLKFSVTYAGSVIDVTVTADEDDRMHVAVSADNGNREDMVVEIAGMRRSIKGVREEIWAIPE